MNEGLQDKIGQYIDAIAQNLGVAAEHVYGIMLKQMIVEGLTYSAIWLLVLIMIPILYTKAARFLYSHREDEWWEEAAGPLIMIGAIASLIPMVIGIIFLPGLIMQIFNPEYYVIQKILEIFK